jgi:hypothetical protein
VLNKYLILIFVAPIATALIIPFFAKLDADLFPTTNAAVPAQTASTS